MVIVFEILIYSETGESEWKNYYSYAYMSSCDLTIQLL